MTEYYIPTQASETEFVEKRSRFIGHVWRVDSEEEARARIEEMKKRYYDARHNCWCYLIKDGAEMALYQILSGGLFLGAFFMATDYVTSPVTKKGEVIFGIGCGLLTVFIRYFGGYPEGVSYSILIMNCCVWLIDKVGKPNRYGVTKEMKAAAKAAKKAGKEG